MKTALLMLLLCLVALIVARQYSRHLEDEACRRRACDEGIGVLLRANGSGRDSCLCLRRY